MSDTGVSDDPDQPASVLGNAALPSQWLVGDASGPGILGPALNPAPWTPDQNSLNFFVDPETMKTIDFAGTDQPQSSQPDGGGFYTGLTPWQPEASDSDVAQGSAEPSSDDGDTTDNGQTSPVSGDTRAAQSSPLTAWPVPGHTDLNPRDPKRGQGDGAFGSPRDHGQGSHTGIDITAPVGTPVVAAGDGTVANIQPNPSTTYGNQVVIQHDGGLNTQYAHLSRVDVKPGDTVHAGDQIGLSGRSGNVPTNADAHLHFETRHGSIRPHSAGGQVDDPVQYLPATP